MVSDNKQSTLEGLDAQSTPGWCSTISSFLALWSLCSVAQSPLAIPPQSLNSSGEGKISSWFLFDISLCLLIGKQTDFPSLGCLHQKAITVADSSSFTQTVSHHSPELLVVLKEQNPIGTLDRFECRKLRADFVFVSRPHLEKLRGYKPVWSSLVATPGGIRERAGESGHGAVLDIEPGFPSSKVRALAC